MVRAYKVEGMTCSNCKTTVEKGLSQVAGVDLVQVNLAENEVEVTTNQFVTVEDLQQGLPEKYTLSEKDVFKTENVTNRNKQEKSKLQQLKPLLLILTYITVAALLMNIRPWSPADFMLDFMGMFFFSFSFFKFLDLKGFAQSFSMYDPLAREFPLYGTIYPFVEVALGIMFFVRFEIEIALAITLCVLSITTVGVLRVLMKKRQIQCACLGSVLKLPMTLATFIENAIMIAMAGSMILGWV